jgi:hypothetical protein
MQNDRLRRPKLAVVVVKKRGNARFFAKMNNSSIINPPPGTIIDHTVTNGKERRMNIGTIVLFVPF